MEPNDSNVSDLYYERIFLLARLTRGIYRKSDVIQHVTACLLFFIYLKIACIITKEVYMILEIKEFQRVSEDLNGCLTE